MFQGFDAVIGKSCEKRRAAFAENYGIKVMRRMFLL